MIWVENLKQKNLYLKQLRKRKWRKNFSKSNKFRNHKSLADLKNVIRDMLSFYIIDRFAPENIPRTDPGCEIIADVAFLIDASGSIQKEYLAQLQFVQYIIAR